MSNITTDFVTATKKLVAEVRTILTTLHLIREDVKTIREDVASQKDKQAANENTHDTRQGETNRLSGRGKVLNVHETNCEENDGSSKERQYFKDVKHRLCIDIRSPRFLGEILTLIVIAAYTSVAFWQGCLTRKIAHTGDEALYYQTRPWLGPAGQITPRTPKEVVHGLPQFHANVPFSVNFAAAGAKLPEYFLSYQGSFRLHNYGPTPALHAAYSVTMILDPNGAKGAGAKGASDGACDSARQALIRVNGTNAKSGIILFPTSESEELFDAAAGIRSTPQSAYLLGCIIYEDTRSKRHTTRFCHDVMVERSCDFETYAD